MSNVYKTKMKVRLAAVISLLVFLISCNEQKREGITSFSPDKRYTLRVSATRAMSLDPWKTSLKAEGNGVNGEIVFELYAGDVSTNNVSFVWSKENTCEVSFQQTDNSVRKFSFTPENPSGIWQDLTPD